MRSDKTIDRRIKRSRKLMQDALLQLLDQKEYSKISVSEITDTADVARTTFYSHFQSKDELLLSYIDDIFETFFSKLQEEYPHGRAEKMEPWVTTMLLEEWKKNKTALDRIRSANVDNLIYQRIYENHIAAFHQFREDSDYESSASIVEQYIASYLSATTFAILIKWTDNNMAEPMEAVAKMLFEFVKRETLGPIEENFQKDLDRLASS